MDKLESPREKKKPQKVSLRIKNIILYYKVYYKVYSISDIESII